MLAVSRGILPRAMTRSSLNTALQSKSPHLGHLGCKKELELPLPLQSKVLRHISFYVPGLEVTRQQADTALSRD